MGGRRTANVVALAVAAAFIAGAVWYNRSLGNRAEVGRAAPGFVLQGIGGRAISLEGMRGQPVLINFWTSWCGPCREEIPALEAFHRQFGARMPIIGVNVREPRSTVETFVAAMGMTYPVVQDADGRVAERYRVRGYPESWLVGPDGVARRFWAGPLTVDALEQAYAELMGEPIERADRP